MKPDQEKVNYTATIPLTNSPKIGFTRRDLALCFFPREVVKKADRLFTSLVVDGVRTHEDNPELIKKLLEIIPKQYIYNGTVRKEDKQSFNQGLISKRLCRDYKLLEFETQPVRQRMGSAQPVMELKITTNTSDLEEHKQIILGIIAKLKSNRQLTFDEPQCQSMKIDVCDI